MSVIVHRLAHQQFIQDLTGLGAKKYGGRWNPVGMAALYASEHLSLAVLEKFVHAQGVNELKNLARLALALPASSPLYRLDIGKLSKAWKTDVAYTQWLGQQLLADGSYLGFWAPSVVVAGEWNLVLNPANSHFKKIQIVVQEAFTLDSRLVAQRSR
jgi:RES domain-containing protein